MGADGGRRDTAQVGEQGAHLGERERLAAADGRAAGQRDADGVEPIVAVFGGLLRERLGEGGGIRTRAGDIGDRAHEEDAAAERLAFQAEPAQLLQPRNKQPSLQRRELDEQGFEQQLAGGGRERIPVALREIIRIALRSIMRDRSRPCCGTRRRRVLDDVALGSPRRIAAPLLSGRGGRG